MKWHRNKFNLTKLEKKKFSFFLFNKITLRFDRPRKVLIINDWLITIRENREDNCEKNISISLFSPPHIKQRRIRRSNWFFFGIISSSDKSCSIDNLICSFGMFWLEFSVNWELRFTIGIARRNLYKFHYSIMKYLLSRLIFNCFWEIKSSRIFRPFDETIRQP
jgi:hypothetical protein